jgi:hypothetical protein
MPPTFANLFRVVIIMLLAAHVFYMYDLSRLMSNDFGFDVGTAVLSALFALAMLMPLVWAVALPDAPEMYVRVFRARRWRKDGRCPKCGYRCVRAQAICSECGAALREPAEYRITVATIRRYLGMCLLAWVIGCLAAEMSVQADEDAFRREAVAAAAGGATEYYRSRRWPMRGGFIWYGEVGFAANH